MKQRNSISDEDDALPVSTTPPDSVPMRGAVRFPLHLNFLLSTPQGECEAVTEDVSANGMLFISDKIPAIGTRVEFRLTMPAAVMGGVEDVLLHCVGRIVRHARTDGKLSAAAVIDEYSLKAEQV